MKIGFKKKQYRLLNQLALIGDWIINGHRTEDFMEESQNLLKYLVSNCSDYGLDDIVYYDEESKKDSHTLEFKKESLEHIGIYSGLDFWDKLCNYLAERDFHKKYTPDEIKKMDKQESLERFYEIADYYAAEFHKNGIDNIILKRK